jgi:hypothetical protein
MVLIGQHDEYLKHAFYYVKYKKTYDGEGPIVDLHSIEMLELVKNQIRRGIQSLFQEESKQNLSALRAKLSETNKPHELGTVAEIAAKYNISKSEVRRRKAEGTLSELTTQEHA